MDLPGDLPEFLEGQRTAASLSLDQGRVLLPARPGGEAQLCTADRVAPEHPGSQSRQAAQSPHRPALRWAIRLAARLRPPLPWDPNP